ncbi:SDR family NAD(P)-dependent oxidoreductase [Paraburkholderia phosphatilytica]|uniref:SDR family NAD(P)-dependent oxidoreductase n=1 Tax=Paraburkholderia phosphatilytica TaxID=2282883 RepID=UPI000E4DB7B7|nr:SDR family NAD(P)-dependent oxidoreductase [Paraburkholderia phosphatilytica]
MQQRFEDKVVIVTGAGSGIGAATAKRFSDEGASVVLCGRTVDKLEKIATGLPADRTLVHAADVRQLHDVAALVAAALERFAQLDVMVNNAGVAPTGAVTELPVEAWHDALATDVSGVFYGCRMAIPHLKETRGSIVNVSSVSGLGGDWGMSFYNAAKGAVTNFTRAVALDCALDGIRVNAVCPSLTATDLTEDMLADDQLMNAFRSRIPLAGSRSTPYAEPEDVAAAIAFLASEDARFITGVNLPVDGGLSASNGQPKQA